MLREAPMAKTLRDMLLVRITASVLYTSMLGYVYGRSHAVNTFLLRGVKTVFHRLGSMRN